MLRRQGSGDFILWSSDRENTFQEIHLKLFFFWLHLSNIIFREKQGWCQHSKWALPKSLKIGTQRVLKIITSQSVYVDAVTCTSIIPNIWFIWKLSGTRKTMPCPSKFSSTFPCLPMELSFCLLVGMQPSFWNLSQLLLALSAVDMNRKWFPPPFKQSSISMSHHTSPSLLFCWLSVCPERGVF